MSSEDEKGNCSSTIEAGYDADHSDLYLMLAGFEDCAAEAIRYLVTEEGFTEDDPVVQGLKDHLEAKKRLLGYQNTANTYLETVDDHDMDSRSELFSSSDTEDLNEDDVNYLSENYESSWTMLMESDEFLSKLIGYAGSTVLANEEMVSESQNTANKQAPSPSPSI